MEIPILWTYPILLTASKNIETYYECIIIHVEKGEGDVRQYNYVHFASWK